MVEVDKKYIIGFFAALLILGGTFFVVSYGTSSPSTFGHSADELEIGWGENVNLSYGNSNWIGVDKSVNCPEGYYVVGIKVSYGGTCRNQCNSDGGIIRDIELDCRKIGA